MASDRFPYDLPSFKAMVELVQRTKPEWRAVAEYVRFMDLEHWPTLALPGRSFIEMENLLTRKKHFFMFKRLDMAVVLANTSIQLNVPPTQRAIVDEINRTKGMFLGEIDTDYLTTRVGGGNSAFIYTLKAKPTSYVYYGQAQIAVNLEHVVNARLLEDGSPRLLENSETRLLES